MNTAERAQDDLGLAAIRQLYEICKIDDEWSVQEDRGFSWWGMHYRQRFWAEPGIEDAGIVVYKLCARTDLLADVPDAAELPRKLGLLNRYATTAALVHDPERRELSWFTSTYVHADTAADFVPRLFAPAAIVQPFESEGKAGLGAEMLGGRPNRTDHPGGPRPEPDDMLNLVPAIHIPAGRGESPWNDAGEFDETVEFLNTGDCFASGGGAGLTAEFPLGEDQTAMLRAFGNITNPEIGNGLMLQLHLPLRLPPDESAALAQALNLLESTEHAFTHTIGAWTTNEIGGRTTPVFVCFIPAAMHHRNLLLNLCLGAAMRCRWVGSVLGGGEPSEPVIDIVTRRLLRVAPPEGNA